MRLRRRYSTRNAKPREIRQNAGLLTNRNESVRARAQNEIVMGSDALQVGTVGLSRRCRIFFQVFVKRKKPGRSRVFECIAFERCQAA